MEQPFQFVSKGKTWGTIPASSNPIILFSAQESNLDFFPSGNFTLGFGDFIRGKTINLFITCDSITRTMSFRETLSWMGGAPTSIAANKKMQISLVCTGPNASDVFATYAVQS